MNLRRILALFFLLTLAAAAQTEAPKPAVKPAAKADDRLKADILLIVAHPDDESGVSAYLAQAMDQGKRVAAIYTTHGEAGHNNMGRERGPSLGGAREMELRHAMTRLGVDNVWFLGGRDTPSQDVLQSLANWHHGEVLEEVVRMVRITRPEVILTWMPGIFIGENHGDHQASGVIATEAFDMAGDPAVFPAQVAGARKVNETLLEDLQPWQPKKIYYFSDANEDSQFKGKGPEYATTAISPTRKMPYWRVAVDVFRYHLTQYKNYIEKFDKLSDAELTKVAEHDQWNTPLRFIFGKSNVGGSVTGDIFEGVKPGAIAYVRPAATAPKTYPALSAEMGGPWNFYEDFRRAHALTTLYHAETPEISVATGTVLQLPVILRNNSDAPAEISLAPTLPEGWTEKDPPAKYQLSPGDVYPVQLNLNVPATKADPHEIVCRANAGGREIGVVKLKVRVGTGGLPQ